MEGKETEQNRKQQEEYWVQLLVLYLYHKALFSVFRAGS